MGSTHLEILLIEDNPGDIRLTQEAFRESRIGSTLRFAHDGEEGIHYLLECCRTTDMKLPDLVFLDWNLPKLNGKEVLKLIRDDGKLKTMPVIVMSSSNAEQDIRDAYNLKANCYVTKPGEFDLYVKMIRSIEQYWVYLKTSADKKQSKKLTGNGL